MRTCRDTPRSLLFDQGPVKSGRPSTPDSACDSEQDWSPPSSSSSSATGADQTPPFVGQQHPARSGLSTRRRQTARPGTGLSVQSCRQATTKPTAACLSLNSGRYIGDSDADSGIASVSHHGTRIGSTSSTDTDTSQDTLSRKAERIQLKTPEPRGTFTTTSVKSPTGNKLSVLNHCYSPGLHSKTQRLGQVPLSIAPPLVQGDDSLHLSEQNVRRSCRKLFATLYAQRDMVRSSAGQPQPVMMSNSQDQFQNQRCSDVSTRNSKCQSHPDPLNPSSVRRNHSCDNLHASHSPYKFTKSVHRLSLQNSSCLGEDMLKVYARPVSVIPQYSPAFRRNSVTSQNSTQNYGDHSVPTISPVLDPEHETYRKTQTLGSRHQLRERSAMNGSPFVSGEEQILTSRTLPAVSSNPAAVLKDTRYPNADSFVVTTDQHQSEESNRSVLSHSVVSGPGGKEVEYAVVNRAQKAIQRAALTAAKGATHVTSQPCLATESKDQVETNKKMIHKSDFALYRGPSSTSSEASSGVSSWMAKSLMERVQGLGRTARMALRKAFSMERIYRPQKQEKQDEAAAAAAAAVATTLTTDGSTSTLPHRKRSRSLVKGIKIRMSRKNPQRKKAPVQQSIQTLRIESGRCTMWDEDDGPNGSPLPEQTWGQLLQLNVDGSQVIELNRAPGKPFGFFVARGRVKNTKGVFVSRMQDESTRNQLAGLLDVGDEILEIEAVDVRAADILEVNTLMAKKRTLLVTVLPYICRKDI